MTIKRGFTDEADQLLNCLVLKYDSLSRSSDTPQGTWNIRRLGTPVPQKLCLRGLPCELPALGGHEPLTNCR